jgi:hypothetical protein
VNITDKKMNEQKHYLVAVKHGAEAKVTAEWHRQLSQIDGVSLLSASANRAQFLATPDAAEKVRAALGADYWIEESSERQALG